MTGNSPAKSRVLFFATESRCHRGPDGRVWSVNPNDWHENLMPWLRTFDQLVLIARVAGAPSDAGRPVEGPNVRVASVTDYKGARQLAAHYLGVRRQVLEYCADGQAFYGGRFPGVLAGLVVRGAQRAKAPVLAQVVGDPRAVLGTGVAGWVGRLSARLAGWSMRNQLRKVDAAIYVTRRQLQDLYPTSPGTPTIARSDVALTPDSFAKEPRPRPSKKNNWRLVAVGSHDQMYKGHDLLISALARLRANGWELSLDIVGSGNYHDRLKAMADGFDLAGHVRFHGHIDSPEDVREILKKSDLFVMPSRTEGVPRALIEAMALGLPCIASNVGGIPEILEPSFLFEANSVDALERAVCNSINENHDWPRQSERNIQSAHSIIEESSAGALDSFLSTFTARSTVRSSSA